MAASSPAPKPVAFQRKAGSPSPAAKPAAATVVAPAAAPPVRPAQAAPAMWQGQSYTVKERRLTFGRQYIVLDGSGNTIAYCRQKMFRLKEDIRFYADKERTQEIFRLAAQKVMDFKAAVNVIDSSTGAVVASIRRKGWKSLLKDEWMFFAPDGRQFGTLHEQGGFRAFMRRWGHLASTFVPARYTLHVGPEGQQRVAATVRERFQLWGDTYDLDRDPAAPFDARLLVAAVVLADAMGVGNAGA